MQENSINKADTRNKIAQRIDFIVNYFFEGKNIRLSKATNGRIEESAISRWRKRTSSPSAKTLQDLEDFAGISKDYILKGILPVLVKNSFGQELARRLSDNMETTIEDAVASMEQTAKILEITPAGFNAKFSGYNRMTTTQILAQTLSKESSNVGSPITALDSKGVIRVFLTPANAGRGFALDDMPDALDSRPLFSNNKDIIVVPVSGDSMEPAIQDGDKVYVDTSRKDPRSGEIVLCNVDGVNYVKFYSKTPEGKVYLVSKNKKYQPFRINGFNNSSIYGVVVQISRTPERASQEDLNVEN